MSNNFVIQHMKRKIGIFLISFLILTVVIVGAVYLEPPLKSTPELNTSQDSTSTLDLISNATTSILRSLPVPKVGTPPAAAAEQIINDRLSLINQKSVFSPTSVSGGPAGTFTVTATFKNVSSHLILGTFFRVVTLTGGNLLLNRSAGTGAVGSRLTAPLTGDYSDGVLTSGETFSVNFTIGLATRARFQFFVDALAPTIVDDWVVFQDENVGYQLIYPPSLAAATSTGDPIEQPNLISLLSLDSLNGPPGKFTVMIFDVSDSIPAWLNTAREGYYRGDVISSILTICGATASKMASSEGGKLGIYFIKDTLLYAIEWQSYNLEESNRQSDFDTLVSSFQCF